MGPFYKRENSYPVFILTTALALSFLINSVIFTWRAVVDQNVEAPKTTQQLKADAFQDCLNEAYGEKKVGCKGCLK